MEYETQYNIGYYSDTKKEKTKKTAQAGKRVRRLDAKSKRRPRNRQGQKEVRAGTNAADGFLKSTFLPKMEVVDTILSCATVDKIRTDFYHSLSEMAEHYNRFEPMDTKMFDYPYNMALSIWEIRNYLKRFVRDWNSLKLVQDSKGKTFFISKEQYDTGTTLYYIPVIPLYKMLRNRETKKVATLLLCVFSYLYHVACIPYYRQEGTYIYWEYEMIADWIEQDDEADYSDHKKALMIAEWCGKEIEKKICNPKNLKTFAARIKAFRPKNDFEQECMVLAKNIFSLYTDFPATSIFEHAQYGRGEADQTEEIITMEKYISFIPDNRGWLYETLAECVNNEFNEYGEIEEPATVKTFDGTTNNNCNLDFENRLFPLIGDLCYLLDND